MRKKGSFVLLCFVIMALGLIGCVPVHVVASLKGEVSQLQIQYRELQQNHADLYAKVDSSLTNLGALDTSVRDLQDKVSILNQAPNLNEMKAKYVKDDCTKSDLPSSVYQNAYGDYSMGKYDVACSEFQSFVGKYPNAELAPQAQFYMGECYYSRGMFDKALEEYDKVEEHYKRSDLVSLARLKMAMCYEMLGKSDESSGVLSSILKDFPQSPEASRAKEKIRTNRNVQTR
ncbi:tol-pal system protein YbgF [Endomicrobiia bacterium]|nr:tol-pal system protein YbgF [Endomicrobiia bacterium]GHT70315.1 tol-pal system protein YbgF [Endomicrobiia bacterium]GHT75191.1 tol-pal system protein YbgF [Endomicrobiia bacterium]